MSRLRRVAITTGDIDGIGLEVTQKALQALGPHQQTQFVLYRSERATLRGLRGFRRTQVSSTQEALQVPLQGRSLIEVLRNDSPALWVEDVALRCLQGDIASMVTGPLSKPEIIGSGLKDLGHTDILKRVSGQKHAFMTFLGPKFNVLLVSGHIPLENVQSSLSEELLRTAVSAAHEAKSLLSLKKKTKPLGLLGLNPHAGDQGLIGEFEQSSLDLWVQKLKKKISIEGPLIPDAAFLESNWRKYSFYIALYHDQGLIPFKMAHGFDAGVHLTLGLPIRRSSVDHGTAKDIFGKNKARPGSMIEAIQWGLRLAHKG